MVWSWFQTVRYWVRWLLYLYFCHRIIFSFWCNIHFSFCVVFREVSLGAAFIYCDVLLNHRCWNVSRQELPGYWTLVLLAFFTTVFLLSRQCGFPIFFLNFDLTIEHYDLNTVESRYLELRYLEFCVIRSIYLNQKYIWLLSPIIIWRWGFF